MEIHGYSWEGEIEQILRMDCRHVGWEKAGSSGGDGMKGECGESRMELGYILGFANLVHWKLP